MLERFLHHAKAEHAVDAEDAAAARVRLGDRFPRAAVRRMTHLGMLLGSAAHGVEMSASDAIVYATSYGETRALEDYLRSFPTPSPLLFQTSIHPSAAQQVLIGRQQPVARLWPIASRARLVEQAMLTALLEPAERVLLLGGEERGTWLLEHGVASEHSFAFAVLATRNAEGAMARVAFEEGSDVDDAPPSLEELCNAIAARRRLSWRGAGGAWSLDWR